MTQIFKFWSQIWNQHEKHCIRITLHPVSVFFFQKFNIGMQHCATMIPYKLLQWIMWSSVPVVVGIFNLFILVVSDYRRLWLHPVANWLPCDSGMFWHLAQYTMATSVGKKFIQAFCKMVTWQSLWSGTQGWYTSSWGPFLVH